MYPGLIVAAARYHARIDVDMMRIAGVSVLLGEFSDNSKQKLGFQQRSPIADHAGS